MSSDRKGINLEINNRKIAENLQNPCRLNHTFLNHTCAKEAISRYILKYFKLYENTTFQICGLQ